MELEVRIPEVGESVQEALLGEWFKADGDRVSKDEVLFLIETDKITLEVAAEADGVLSILVPAGETVAVGTVVGRIAAGEGAAEAKAAEAPTAPPAPPAPEAPPPAAAPAPAGGAARPAAAAPPPAPPAENVVGPSVRRLAAEQGVDLGKVTGTGPGGRVTKGDVVLHLEQRAAPAPAAPAAPGARPEEPPARPAPNPDEPETRKRMSPIRRRIAARLVEAKQSTAMLTTFNEIDMGRVAKLRAKYKESFREKHGVSLGVASFFVKALVGALREFPALNAFVDGDEIVYHDYYHVGMAIGSERGLVVPVIRHADRLSLAGIERAVADFVAKVRDNRLELAELEGGTFTVTNGGVFGSLLSTPILNPPQSGILGLHKIEERPVAVDGQVVIRPMMYLALSYDHRIVDGREAVRFLVRVKEEVEDPERLLVEV